MLCGAVRGFAGMCCAVLCCAGFVFIAHLRFPRSYVTASIYTNHDTKQSSGHDGIIIGIVKTLTLCEA